MRESRFLPWDVETFLANRHQAKIDTLTASESQWARRWMVTKELATMILAYIGIVAVTTIAGLWLLLGEFPIQRGQFDGAAPAITAEGGVG